MTFLLNNYPCTICKSKLLSGTETRFRRALMISNNSVTLVLKKELWVGTKIGTLRYEDGKARTGTAVDAGNFRGSRCVVKNKMLKMRIFSKDGDVNNSTFQATPFTETVTSFRL